jgi:hypothetical protein
VAAHDCRLTVSLGNQDLQQAQISVTYHRHSEDTAVPRYQCLSRYVITLWEHLRWGHTTPARTNVKVATDQTTKLPHTTWEYDVIHALTNVTWSTCSRLLVYSWRVNYLAQTPRTSMKMVSTSWKFVFKLQDSVRIFVGEGKQLHSMEFLE